MLNSFSTAVRVMLTGRYGLLTNAGFSKMIKVHHVLRVICTWNCNQEWTLQKLEYSFLRLPTIHFLWAKSQRHDFRKSYSTCVLLKHKAISREVYKIIWSIRRGYMRTLLIMFWYISERHETEQRRVRCTSKREDGWCAVYIEECC